MDMTTFTSGIFKGLCALKRKKHNAWFKCAVMMGLFSLASWQEASAISTWDEYSDLDKVTWNPDRGTIQYKIRVYQTWGASLSGYCGFGIDGQALTITQNSKDKHVIKVQMNEDGQAVVAEIDGRDLLGNWKVETSPDSGEDETTRFLTFEVPVSQGDLGTTVSIDLAGHWWRMGATPDEDISESSYRKVAITYPQDPKLQITKVYYGCSDDDKNNPRIYFDWTRQNTDGIAGSGGIFLCEADSSTRTSHSGITGQQAEDKPSRFAVTAYQEPFHDLSKSYKYKLRQEVRLGGEINGIQCDLQYVFESNVVTVNAYPQVDDIKCALSNSVLTCTWTIPTAPAEDYDSSPFLLTIKKTMGDSVTTQTEEIDYTPGMTKYSYDVTTSTGEITYGFSVMRAATKDLSCYDIFKRSISASVASGSHVYPKNPHATNVPGIGTVKITWEKDGVVWTEGTIMLIHRTEMSSLAHTDTIKTKEEFEQLSFEDKDVHACKSYNYSLELIPGNGMAAKKLDIEEQIEIGGCELEPAVFLTIQDGANGKTALEVGNCKTFKLVFKPEEGWEIGSVTFNGTDVTDQLDYGFFTTPEITANSTLSVVYKKYILTNARMRSSSLLRVWVNEGKVIVGNAQIGSEVTVTDMMGRTIFMGKVDSSEMELDFLGKGIFLVKVEEEVFKVSL